MEGFCIQLLYAFLAQCLANTGDMALCGPRVEDFRPIYTLSECNQSSQEDLLSIIEKGPYCE